MSDNPSNSEISKSGDAERSSNDSPPSGQDDAENTAAAEENESAPEVAPNQLADRRKKAPTVDRTKLDVDAVREMAATAKADQESRLRDELDARPIEPAKPFQSVTDYKPAFPCSSASKNSGNSETVSFCEKCRLRVYDLKDVEKPEAEELIFKMEGRRNVLLFKRADGKFLTKNCPIGVRRKFINTAGAAFGAATILGLAALLLTPTNQQPARSVNSTNNDAPANSSVAIRMDQISKKMKSVPSSSDSLPASNKVDGPFSNVVSIEDVAKFQRAHDPQYAGPPLFAPTPQQTRGNSPTPDTTGTSPQSSIPQPDQTAAPEAQREQAGTTTNPGPTTAPMQAPAQTSPLENNAASNMNQPVDSTSAPQQTENPYVRNYK